MSRHHLVSAIAILSLGATQAHAQDVNTSDTKAPVEKTSAEKKPEFIKARYHTSGNVSPEEQQRILAEADKIRAYREAQARANAQTYQSQTYQPQNTQSYIYSGSQTGPRLMNGTPVQYKVATPQAQGQQVPNYQGQSYPTQSYQGQPYPAQNNGQIQGPFYQSVSQPSTIAAPGAQIPIPSPQTSTTYMQSAPAYQGQQPQYQQQQPIYQAAPQATIPATYMTPAVSHPVMRGDTLYRISKRYGVPLSTLKQANGLSGNTISIGQVLTVPSVHKVISTPASTQPSYQYQQAQPTQPQSYRPVSYQGTYPGTLTYSQGTQVRTTTPTGQSRLVRTNTSTGATDVYAVLPKDTLYGIARTACVKPGDIARVNNIADPSALQPGQRLTMPPGHCL